MEDFEWSEKHYTPLQLIEKFDAKFPLVAMVTKGYHGENSFESLSQSQILGLHDWGFHQRVVCKDAHNRYHSIPVTYPAEFTANGKTGTLREMIDKSSFPLEVEMVGVTNVVQSTDGSSIELQKLKVIDTYQERYIKGNLIRDDGVNQETIIIPVHLDVTFVVSKPGKRRDEWRVRSIQMIDEVHRIPVDTLILHYSPTMIENVTGDFNKEVFYESLIPIQVSMDPQTIRLKTKTTRATATVIPFPPSPASESPTDNIGDDVNGFTIDQVVNCLRLLNLGKYEGTFRGNHIDGALLTQMDVQDCVKDLGMGGVEAKRLIKFAGGWRPK